jgi:regulatory protein spx
MFFTLEGRGCYMVTLYVTSSCLSCRKAKDWLIKNDIPFKERHIYNEPLSLAEIKNIMRLTDEGTEEIISKRSKTYQELKIDVNQLTLKELYELIQKYPSILKRPIMVDEKRLQVGYNEDEIRKFLPRKVREYELYELQKMIN